MDVINLIYNQTYTIMKKRIGEHAGEIWHLLYSKGKLNLRDIGEATNYGQDVIFLSLGWLLRENKIRISNINGSMFYELDEFERSNSAG